MRRRPSSTQLVLTFGAMLLVTACAAGSSRYTIETPAGFWQGLWHGIISVIAFIVGLFNDRVEIYERFNNGAWYDLGFLLGILSFWGGGSHANKRVWPRKKTANEKEWEEIGKKVEAKIQRKIRQWAEAEPDEDWEVVGEKAEAKLKMKLREWAEDETPS